MTAAEKQIERYKRALGILHDALCEYAQPEFYHAVAFLMDPPGGGFMDDFQRKHGDPGYDRPMPGKIARQALSKVRKRYGDLGIYTKNVSDG